MEMCINGLKKEKEKKTKPQNKAEIFRSCKLKEQPGNYKLKIQEKIQLL